jgi:hypothetical protein
MLAYDENLQVPSSCRIVTGPVIPGEALTARPLQHSKQARTLLERGPVSMQWADK